MSKSPTSAPSDDSRAHERGRGRARALGWGIAAVAAFVVLAATSRHWLPVLRPPAPQRVAITNLQGELISAPLTNSNADGTRRERYKPGSLPQRLVQFQYRVARGDVNSNAFVNSLKAAYLPPGFVIYTNDVGLKTSLTPDARGYANIGFDFLSAFSFNLDADLANKGGDSSLAAQKVRAQIPAEVRALDRRRVRLRGFLVPVRMDDELTVEFLVMRDQTLCCYGTVPKVNEWVHVRVTGRGVESIMDLPITVEGTLSVGDRWENGYFAGIYFLEATKAEFDKRR